MATKHWLFRQYLSKNGAENHEVVRTSIPNFLRKIDEELLDFPRENICPVNAFYAHMTKIFTTYRYLELLLCLSMCEAHLFL